LRSSLDVAGFAEMIYDGWRRGPVGHSGDGELVVFAVAQPQVAH
jgi:hypothetical protein